MYLSLTNIFARTLPRNVLNRQIERYMSTKSNHYDIVIAGGGMVGTTLACALGNSKKLSNNSILLLEGSKQFSWKLTDRYSNRVSALTPSTKELLESIGVWPKISETRYGSVKKMQVWDACSDAMITFNEDDLQDTIAYIVENDVLLSSVNQVIKKFQNITILNEAKIKGCILPHGTENTANIYMEDGKEFTCSLLLGADGAKSKVRQAMKVQYLAWDYNQMGLVATLQLSDASDNSVAWQRFMPTGPIAILPLNRSQSSLVWTTTPAQAKELLKMSEEEFIDALNHSLWKVFPMDNIVEAAMKGFNSLLESLSFPSNAVRQLPPNIVGCVEKSRAAFPLGFGHSTSYVANGAALVGDAAHRVHPLAGQGVNLGFGDVSSLVKLLENAVYSGQNIGSVSHLKEYESERQRHNIPTMIVIDGLQKLYNTTLTPVVVLRSLGLQFTHAMKPLKKAIMDHAIS